MKKNIKFVFMFLLVTNCVFSSGNNNVKVNIAEFLKKYEDYVKTEYIFNYLKKLDDSQKNEVLKIALQKKIFDKKRKVYVLHKIGLSVFLYKSIEMKIKAQESWLNCFSVDCAKLAIMKDEKGIKSPPIFTLFLEKSIIVLTTRCESPEPEWERNKIDLEACFAGKKMIVLDVCCGGPIKWRKN